MSKFKVGDKVRIFYSGVMPMPVEIDEIMGETYHGTDEEGNSYIFTNKDIVNDSTECKSADTKMPLVDPDIVPLILQHDNRYNHTSGYTAPANVESIGTCDLISNNYAGMCPPTPTEQWQKEAEGLYPYFTLNGTRHEFTDNEIIDYCRKSHIIAREIAHAALQQRDRELQGELDRIVDALAKTIFVHDYEAENKLLNKLRSLTSLPTEQSDNNKNDEL